MKNNLELKFAGNVPDDKDLAIKCECGYVIHVDIHGRKTSRVDVTCKCGKVFQFNFQKPVELN